METLDTLHSALHGLTELHTIVRTMKALSAASIRQYEQAVEALGSYQETVEDGLHVILRDMPLPRANATPPARVRPGAAIVFGSDHGLCGRFNETVAEHALSQLPRQEEPTARVLAVGARVTGLLEQEGHGVEETLLLPSSASQITLTVRELLLRIDAWRELDARVQVHLFYARHDDGTRPCTVTLLPVDPWQLQRLRERPWPSRRLPTYAMRRSTLFRRFLNQYLFVSLFRACAESLAAEHASRLSAMQEAQRNLEERREEVTRQLRRARQNAITAELLDVVAGFEAMTRPGDTSAEV